MSATNLQISTHLPSLLWPVVEGSKDLSLDLLNDLILLCPDAIIGANREGRIILFNRAAERLLGYSSGQMIDRRSVVDAYGSIDKAREIKRKIHSPDYGGEGSLAGYECEVMNSAGRSIPIRLSASLLYSQGREVGSVGFFHDISERKRLEAELVALSIRDALSGLYNQRYFYSKLEEEVSRGCRSAGGFALICIDLDHFKLFNDTLGHLEGDRVIQFMGTLLHNQVRDIDVPCRYGGDEFVVLLPGISQAGGEVFAQRIVDCFNQSWPFQALCRGAGIAPVTLSVGVAGAGAGESGRDIVKRADEAMYRAKRGGTNRVVTAG